VHPVLFEIGPINVYSFGLMLALGFSLAVLVSFLNARRHGLDPWLIVDMALYLFIAGLLGSRLLFVALNWEDYAGAPLVKLLATWEGGVSFFGAIAGGFVAVVLFSLRHRLDLWRVADTVSPGLALAAAVGRVGCFLNGCCYGLPTEGFWGTFTRFAPGLRHPTQLYESVLYFLVFGFLLWWQRRGAKAAGQLFLAFVACYLVARGAVEFFREGQRLYPWLSLTQAASIPIFLAAVTGYFYLGRRARRQAEAGGPAPPGAPDAGDAEGVSPPGGRDAGAGSETDASGGPAADTPASPASKT